MLPFMTQPAVAPACYVAAPGGASTQSQLFGGAQSLTKTWSSACTDCTRMFFSAVVHRSAMGTVQPLLNVHSGANNTWDTHIRFDASDRLTVSSFDGVSTFLFRRVSAQVFRDPAPMHLLVAIDTNAAAADRIRVYVNGSRITTWLTGNAGYPQYVDPSPGHTLAFGSTLPHRIGAAVNGSAFFSGLLSSIDYGVGVPQVTGMGATAFGTFNIHGQWVHKAYTGSYGTHGAKLWFDQPLAPGHDASGAGNHWNATGFDSTGKDTVASSPTKVMPTFKPLHQNSNVAISEGGWRATGLNNAADNISALCSIPAPLAASIKTEFTYLTASSGLYPLAVSFSDNAGHTFGLWMTGEVYGQGGVVGNVGSFAVNDVISFTYNVETGEVVVQRKSGSAVTTVWTFTAGARAIVTFGCGVSGGSSVRINTGQLPWAIPAPSGFQAYSTDALAEPSIKDPAQAVAQATATGANILDVLDAATAHWGGAAWVEIVKRRDAAEDWRVRFSDDPDNAWAFNNANAKALAPALVAAGAYVGHRLRVGKKYGVWSGEVAHTTGTATTVIHGLDTARYAVIASRVSAGGGDRYLRHPDVAAGQLLKLNGVAPPAADGTLATFGVNSFQIGATAPSGTYRVIVLAERLGWLSLTNYAGTGDASDGAFVAMGISPLLTITTRINTTGNRYVNDALRPGYNPTVPMILDQGIAEPGGGVADLVVGGIKMRNADASQNGSGSQYIAIGFGRPIGGVCVAPATAR